MTISKDELSAFVDAAVTCIGWTTPIVTESGDYYMEHGEPVEHADGSEQWDTLRAVVEAENREELEAFATEHYDALMELSGDMSQHGHDYVLTAGRHGAGYWDRGYPTDVERPITEAAHAGTGSHLVMADASGRLHYSQG